MRIDNEHFTNVFAEEGPITLKDARNHEETGSLPGVLHPAVHKKVKGLPC
jgi:hypothetical protein